MKEIDRVLEVLRSRERAELLAETALAQAETQMEMGRILAFLPLGTAVARVAGPMSNAPAVVDTAALTQRALLVREDMKAAQGRWEQFRWEQRAAEKLRIPELVLSAGEARGEG